AYIATAYYVLQFVFHILPPLPLFILPMTIIFSIFLLWMRHFLTITFWLKLWMSAAPWIICLLLFLPVRNALLLPFVTFSWMIFGLWGYYRFYPLFLIEFHLHK